jgi:hypothetical protein
MFNRSLVHTATLALTASACARPQTVLQPTPTAPTAVTVVHVARETLSSVGATPGLVIVVRDADLPDRGLGDAAVQIERAGTDPRTGRGTLTGPDGMARPVAPDTGAFTVLVRRIGYGRFQFDVRLEPACHHTLEIYVGRDYTFHGRRTSSRAVLTTCAPATP